MAAGQGFKTFTSGDVLTAADVNGYLMQGVGVFTDAANRDAEITSPQEGQFAYLKDTNVTTYYTGSAWANLDTTGMTNPMTTTGDTIYSSSGSTPARLGIGSTGQVLTVAAGIPSWSTIAAGGMTVLASGTLSGTSVTLSSISGDYKMLSLRLIDFNLPSSSTIDLEYNADTSSTYVRHGYYGKGSDNPTFAGTSETGQQRLFWFGPDSGDQNNYAQVDYFNYATGAFKLSEVKNQYVSGGNRYYDLTQGIFPSTSAITQIKIKSLSGSFAGGTYELLGLK